MMKSIGHADIVLRYVAVAFFLFSWGGGERVLMAGRRLGVCFLLDTIKFCFKNQAVSLPSEITPW